MSPSRFDRRRFLASTAAAASAAVRRPLRSHFPRGRIAGGRLLGPLGAGRERYAHQAVQRMGGEGEGRHQDRLHHLARQQDPADHRRRRRRPKAGTTSSRFPTWYCPGQAANLEPVDDLVQPLIAKYGKPGACRRIPRQAGRPLGSGAGHRGQPGEGAVRPHRPVQAARRSRSDQDVPARRAAGQSAARTSGPGTLSWTPREKCHKAGFPFGIGMGQTADSVDSAGAIFAAYGAHLVDAKGDITVNSDATPPGAGLLQAAGAVPARGRVRLG